MSYTQLSEWNSEADHNIQVVFSLYMLLLLQIKSNFPPLASCCYTVDSYFIFSGIKFHGCLNLTINVIYSKF